MKKSLGLLLAVWLVLVLLPSCGGDSQPSGSMEPDKVGVSPIVEKPEEIILADDDHITATFERLYDAVSWGVEGVFYIDIRVENKRNEKIWVYLEEASVNDEAVPLVTSGVPLYIPSKKSGSNSFSFSFSSLSIDETEDVKKVEFDLVVANAENLEEIDRIDSVKLEF